jgi:hypothetical protein
LQVVAVKVVLLNAAVAVGVKLKTKIWQKGAHLVLSKEVL